MGWAGKWVIGTHITLLMPLFTCSFLLDVFLFSFFFFLSLRYEARARNCESLGNSTWMSTRNSILKWTRMYKLQSKLEKSNLLVSFSVFSCVWMHHVYTCIACNCEEEKEQPWDFYTHRTVELVYIVSCYMSQVASYLFETNRHSYVAIILLITFICTEKEWENISINMYILIIHTCKLLESHWYQVNLLIYFICLFLYSFKYLDIILICIAIFRMHLNDHMDWSVYHLSFR